MKIILSNFESLLKGNNSSKDHLKIKITEYGSKKDT